METTNPQMAKSNNMATVAAIFGLISVFLAQTIIIPLLFGSLAIVLAVLSKGYNKKMSTPATIGMITSLLSIVIAVAITIGSFWMYENDPEFRAQADDTFKILTGMTMEEYYNSYPNVSIPETSPEE